MVAVGEALRQEVAGSTCACGVIEPGAVATHLASHNRLGVLEGIGHRYAGAQPLQPATSPRQSPGS